MSLPIILLGLSAAVLGWLVRSAFDIFYVDIRERKRLSSALRMDVATIQRTYLLLNQDKFLGALAGKDVELAKKFSSLALTRAKDVQTDFTSIFGGLLYRLDEQDIENILGFYRGISASRIIFDQICRHFEEGRFDEAVRLAEEAVPIFAATQEDGRKILSGP